MSSLTTRPVVALSLCLLLLGFSYIVEAAARPIITDDAGTAAVTYHRCDMKDSSCHHDDECNNICSHGGICYAPPHEKKIDVNFFGGPVTARRGCCCYRS
ncbi:hypothetical protein MKW94_002621 [Papaver nudicaule]|uniref:Uncharacterized protein n=1 Tax=Papaver nudicaule TaxID=74823 RepID=A0AA41S5X5_PAPNU|nr:hypothetical protein [Papaver nudicaule]